MTRRCFCGHPLELGAHYHAINRFTYSDGSEVFVGPYYSLDLAQAAIDAYPDDPDLTEAEVVLVNLPEQVAS